MEGWSGRQGSFRIRTDVNSENECVRVPPPEVEGGASLVDPPDRQALEAAYGLWVVDRDAVVFVLVEIFDT